MVPVAHFERKYHIAPHGAVWNLGTEQWLQPTLNPNGYLKVGLSLDSQSKQVLLHRLVALHFLPNPYGHPQVNHKDGDKLHNAVSNLEWVSAEENTRHALEMGLRPGYMPLAEKVILLERTLAGELLVDLAREIGWGPESLTRMLRTTADKKGMRDHWNTEMKRRRKLVAIKNIESWNDRNT